jgi:hypothetical protein
LFEQSTRKCNWETYEGKEFLEEIEGMKVKARLFGFAPTEYVDIEFKRRKEKMRRLAWQRGWKNLSDNRIRIWAEKERKETEEERARKEEERARRQAKEQERQEIQKVYDLEATLCACELSNAIYFFSMVIS